MSDIKELKEQLFLTKKNGRLVEDDVVLAKADEYCEGYKAFLDAAKTEREAVTLSVELAKKVVEACEKPSNFAPIYDEKLSIKEKINAIATKIYGANNVVYTTQAEKSLAELTAHLCRKFGLDENDVIRHYDVTGKHCPLYYVTHPEAWDSFRAHVKALLNNSSEAEKSFCVKVMDGALNIRKTPSLTAPVMGVITDGGVYTIVATAYSGSILWGKLKSGAGWISLGSKYVRRIQEG